MNDNWKQTLSEEDIIRFMRSYNKDYAFFAGPMPSFKDYVKARLISSTSSHLKGEDNG